MARTGYPSRTCSQYRFIESRSYSRTGSSRFVPLTTLGSGHEKYTLFSLEHLTDLVNLFFLLTPFLLLALVLVIRNGKRALASTYGRFLGIAALGGLIFAFLWNPDLGMERDWDLFAPFLLPVLLLAAYFLTEKPAYGLFFIMILLAAANTALFLETYRTVRAWSPSISALPLPEMEYPTDIVWDEGYELLGYDVDTTNVAPGEEVTLTLHFRGRKQLPVGYTIFLHLVDGEGVMLAQDDHQPYPPTEYWPPGEIQTGAYTITIPEETEPQELQIMIGSYFYQTLERLPMVRESQAVQNNISELLSIEVE